MAALSTSRDEANGANPLSVLAQDFKVELPAGPQLAHAINSAIPQPAVGLLSDDRGRRRSARSRSGTGSAGGGGRPRASGPCAARPRSGFQSRTPGGPAVGARDQFGPAG